MKYSVLDLAPVPEGTDAVQAMKNTGDLAQRAEALGYHRYWMAEHHNMPGIASAATSVLIGHVAGLTRRIRVGAGGIMLPNHAPLTVAEQFGTLATLYGDRIDLGLGRAPGGDPAVYHALRRAGSDDFAGDVAELIGYLGDPHPDAPVRALPGEGTRVPVWILGSSLYGAQLAAQMGLPYAFASHFAPDALDQAAEMYRRYFKPSGHLDAPKFMLAINVFGADTDEEGLYLRSTMQQAFARLRTGQRGKLPRPVRDIDAVIGAGMRRAVDQALRVSAVGSVDTVKRQLAEWIERYAPDEVILTGQIHDHAARVKSFAMAAEALDSLA
ncbi:LLM class flavin-dependent oxidoreductase [Sulfitobacter mediterraneus]|uniref:LLM class flavin-dependent oxidoreductase n=1 Tax=Sulfitobacter mediterraneus TaxID=83219 RepID=UPI0019399851|nr:LLM class flavin-dependent oxidoreductase [Sulfitobacter mediterraneus]MBM1556634.1 LLM class flavin-dependent oxidoreductase [Sulfitobacter mediterraneus]MBM1569740.1 LLM class flavin-dependent oxidoreductase [Sulfitobacter mediterraneus]MBM1573697.1 LLM class flavin-dependent oxidoreductase [Sulfitobacter mediterraneus]MBM1577486.1 LLM class flavin-dependent oxidoreductase [Sulfitobacter mediterraneus]MBM1579592.1 LLM class flavin-dependent oxidoreductase [Sulfitobacter mediterraneus]